MALGYSVCAYPAYMRSMVALVGTRGGFPDIYTRSQRATSHGILYIHTDNSVYSKQFSSSKNSMQLLVHII